jgi:hypothetical protein
MAPEAVHLLKRLQIGSLYAEEPQEPRGEAFQQVRNVLKLHRDYRLEQGLRTSKYLTG